MDTLLTERMIVASLLSSSEFLQELRGIPPQAAPLVLIGYHSDIDGLIVRKDAAFPCCRGGAAFKRCRRLARNTDLKGLKRRGVQPRP